MILQGLGMAPYPHTDHFCKGKKSGEEKHTINFTWQGRLYSQQLQGRGPHDRLALINTSALPVWHLLPQAEILSAFLPRASL